MVSRIEPSPAAQAPELAVPGRLAAPRGTAEPLLELDQTAVGLRQITQGEIEEYLVNPSGRVCDLHKVPLVRLRITEC